MIIKEQSSDRLKTSISRDTEKAYRVVDLREDISSHTKKAYRVVQ